MKRQWSCVALVVLSMLASPCVAQEALTPAATKKIDFRTDIYPLLKDHCFSCHQGAKASSGYRLDLRSELLGETNGKPLVKMGHGAESRLIQVVAGMVPGKIMPRKGPRLNVRQIGLLRAWIDQGLAWDEQLLPALPLSDHWAFQPVRRPPVPGLKHGLVRNPIDSFILARQQAEGLAPNHVAEGRVLVRRLYLDLLGLPPSLEEVEAFCKDTTSDAYEKLVERVLASPHYGERWARHWLDLARWAESEGYESNHPRLFAWRYRDWVVQSFNSDKPYDQFVRKQLAGDEITPYTDDNLIATGFLAAARLSSNEEDRWRQRNDIFVDIVNATASTFLGLTMQCAQCHNHKFDPITARDYYRFQGFFLKGQPGNLALKDPKQWAGFEAKKPRGYDEAVRERDDLFELGRKNRIAEVKKTLSVDALQALDLALDKRSMEQENLVRQADLQFQFTANQIEKGIPEKDRARYEELKKNVAGMEKTMIEKPQTFGFYSPITSPNQVTVLSMKGFYPLLYDPNELGRARPDLLVAGDVHRPRLARGFWGLFCPGGRDIFAPGPSELGD
jgi:mono/diheme cytochrome c family protein